jgi:hypothetical protein
LARETAALLKATSASPPAPVMATKSASPVREIAALVLTVTAACAPMAIVAATRKVATASPNCPAARQWTGNQNVHSSSLPKPSPVGDGFALLHLAA